jgi:predicted enzyme related to lactoylglutathione lyase
MKMRSESANAVGSNISGFVCSDRDVDLAAELVRKAGGKILDKGEFCPGEPYLYCADPDGYVIEIWYELPTRLDPKR